MSPLPLGGVDRIRTDALLHAKQALFQLSYDPTRNSIPSLFRSVVKLFARDFYFVPMSRKLYRPYPADNSHYPWISP